MWKYLNNKGSLKHSLFVNYTHVEVERSYLRIPMRNNLFFRYGIKVILFVSCHRHVITSPMISCTCILLHYQAEKFFSVQKTICALFLETLTYRLPSMQHWRCTILTISLNPSVAQRHPPAKAWHALFVFVHGSHTLPCILAACDLATWQRSLVSHMWSHHCSCHSRCLSNSSAQQPYWPDLTSHPLCAAIYPLLLRIWPQRAAQSDSTTIIFQDPGCHLHYSAISSNLHLHQPLFHPTKGQ